MRIMADPDDGFAPMEWQYGGSRGPAPPVVLARKDKLPFSKADWDAMEAYIGEWLEENGEAEENRSEVAERWLNPESFRQYVSSGDNWPGAFLSLRFPVGSVVVPQGLSSQELNGVEGTVVQYSRDRVGIQFPNRAVTAVRPDKLTLVRGPPTAPELEPAAKRQDTGLSKEEMHKREERSKEVERQEADQIARRFVDCLHQDEFPEMGDLHLFGVGGEYRHRATEVLGVWQGAVKNQGLTAEAIAEALITGKVKELFEEACHKLASSRAPNATYAKDLIEAKFAAMEWDTL